MRCGGWTLGGCAFSRINIMSDGDHVVVHSVRTDSVPTSEQVERGLRDHDPGVRLKCAQRMDWTPTHE